LARRGHRVLLVDLDPQAHLSLHFGVELRDDQASIYDVLTDSTPVDEVLLHVAENTSIVPADIDLAGAEAELVSVTGREVVLREALERLPGEYDFMLIDCPPSLGVLTVNALVAVEEVLIPLQAHFLALQGLSRLLDTVTLVRQRINPLLSVNGIVLCMHDASTRLASEVVDDLANFLGSARGTNTPWANARLYNTRIRRNIKLAESSSFGQTVFDYAPRSNGAIDYGNLAAELAGDDTETPAAVESPKATHARQDQAAKSALPAAEDATARSDEPQPATVPDVEPDVSPVQPWSNNVPGVNASEADAVTSTS